MSLVRESFKIVNAIVHKKQRRSIIIQKHILIKGPMKHCRNYKGYNDIEH